MILMIKKKIKIKKISSLSQCSQIHKKIFGKPFNLRDDDQKQAFRDAGAHEDEAKCCVVVGDGVECVDVCAFSG